MAPHLPKTKSPKVAAEAQLRVLRLNPDTAKLRLQEPWALSAQGVQGVQGVLVLLWAPPAPIGFRPTIVKPQTHLGTTLRLVRRDSVLRQWVLRGPD